MTATFPKAGGSGAETDPIAQPALATHAALKTGTHGIPAMLNGQGLLWNGTTWVATDLATQAELDAHASAEVTARASAITAHEADTTAVHGIADTALLLRAGWALGPREWRSGLWYAAPTAAPTTGATTLDNLEAGELIVPPTGPRTITSLAFEVTTLSATGVGRVLLYADDPAAPGRPGALLLDAGTVAAATTGTKTITLGTAFTFSAPGRYWAAFRTEVATFSVRATKNMATGMIGSSTATFAIQFAQLGWAVVASGAVPDPFPTGMAAASGATRIAWLVA